MTSKNTAKLSSWIYVRRKSNIWDASATGTTFHVHSIHITYKHNNIILYNMYKWKRSPIWKMLLSFPDGNSEPWWAMKCLNILSCYPFINIYYYVCVYMLQKYTKIFIFVFFFLNSETFIQMELCVSVNSFGYKAF